MSKKWTQRLRVREKPSGLYLLITPWPFSGFFLILRYFQVNKKPTNEALLSLFQEDSSRTPHDSLPGCVKANDQTSKIIFRLLEF